MITLCTVVNEYTQNPSVLQYGGPHFEYWEDILIDSINRTTTMISEIVVSSVGMTEAQWREGLSQQKQRKSVGTIPIKRIYDGTCPHVSQGHAYGLHNALSAATNDYVMFCDPDVFFYTDVPKLYYDLMTTLDLAVVGVTHYSPFIRAEACFPSVLCSLYKKSTLPAPDWMSGRIIVYDPNPLSGHLEHAYTMTGIKVDGKYITHGPMPEVAQFFPNPEGLYDVGCKLWYWNYERGGKWLSFPPLVDMQTYMTDKHYANFEVPNTFSSQQLLFHKCMNNPVELFVKKYRDFSGV